MRLPTQILIGDVIAGRMKMLPPEVFERLPSMAPAADRQLRVRACSIPDTPRNLPFGGGDSCVPRISMHLKRERLNFTIQIV